MATAWTYLTHDQARSKACRWGEDGIAGLCDRYQILCFSLALWNGRDPILKERMFGLTPHEGNHGEDVKEYYFYLDATPTYSYVKMLYKYPQTEFPYQQLIEENRARGGKGLEYELLDTGAFEGGRYFDVMIEYAKAAAEDIAVRIEAFNRGPEDAQLDLVPQLWFRNTWAWTNSQEPEPVIREGQAAKQSISLLADDRAARSPANLLFEYRLGQRYLYGPAGGTLLFTNNETNGPAVYGAGAESRKEYTKDAFHRAIIGGEDCLNPQRVGTKAGLRYRMNVPAGGSIVLRLRFAPDMHDAPLEDVDAIVERRKQEADEFYKTVHPARATEEEKMIQRQALAGMLWGNQIYLFDVQKWLEGDDARFPPPASRKSIRNVHWRHLNSMRVLSMPDKWEYPWFAAWDLAFHCQTLALVDRERRQRQFVVSAVRAIPAPERANSRIRMGVFGFESASARVGVLARLPTGKKENGLGRPSFSGAVLPQAADELRVVGQQGRQPRIERLRGWLPRTRQHHRSRPQRKTAGRRDTRAVGRDGMDGIFLPVHDAHRARAGTRESRRTRRWRRNFSSISSTSASAMKKMGGRGYQLWDERTDFSTTYCDIPTEPCTSFKVRSLVGLIPLFAVEVLEESDLSPFPRFVASVDWFIRNRPDLVGDACYSETREGVRRHILSIVDRGQLSRILEHLWNPEEFLSDGGNSQPFEVSRERAIRLRRPRSEIRAGGSGFENQGRKFELARADLVSDVVSDHRIAEEIQRRVWGRLHGDDARKQRQGHHAATNGGGDRGPDDPPVYARRERTAAHLRRDGSFSKRCALAGPAALPRVFSRRQWRGIGREPSDRLDGTGGESD